MNANNLFQIVQQGFRISVGATASLIETIQDPQKREATLTELKTEISHKTQEWAEKGENTEQEARKFIDHFLKQRTNQTNATATTTDNHSSTSQTGTTKNDSAESEIQELTEQIMALRTELEQLRREQTN
jgi:polyhydroxyalkanoate synthesis regulator phasin